MLYLLLDSSSFVDKLSSIITKIFNQVLSPILEDILTVVCKLIGDVIWTMLGDLLLTLLIAVCNIVDFIAGLFDIFSGAAPVIYRAEGEAVGTQMPLINVFFELEPVTLAFLVVTLMAIGLCFLFTIFSVAGSMADVTLDSDAKPISKVLKSAARACVMFMLVPFLSVTMLHLSSLVTQQASAALNPGNQASVGTVIFLTGSLPAAKSSGVSNLPGVPQLPGTKKIGSLNTGVWKEYMDGAKSYQNRTQVDQDFDCTKFDYVTSLICAVVLSLMLLGAILLFIGRVFELLILYLVSPIFVSTIPRDDGALFKKWRELFIAKFFSGFGCVFSMKFYLMIVPHFVGGSIDFGSGNGEMDCILKVFFIIGGAWAVYKGQHLILQILNPAAANLAQQSAMMATAMAMSGGGKVMAMSGLAGGGGPQNKVKSKTANASSQKPVDSSSLLGNQSEADNQAFRGKKV